MIREWIIPIAYLIGWIWTARTIAIRMIDAEARRAAGWRQSWRTQFREPHRDDGKPLVDGEDRVMSLVMGILIASVWPLALIVLAASSFLRSPTEIAEADRVELERLRKLAREHNLPMPGGDS